MVAIGKGKMVMIVGPLLLVELAKLLIKIAIGLVEWLLSESCLEKELLVKQFCSNWNREYMAVTSLKKGG